MAIYYNGHLQATKGGGGSSGGGGAGHVYSTTEQVVGTWIDGKPLYEKTFEWSNVKCGNESESEMTHDLVDVDFAFVYLALYKDTSSSLFSSWSNCTSSIIYNDNAETPLNWQVGASKVYWLGDWANPLPSRHYKAVIRYTKTTDTV